MTHKKEALASLTVVGVGIKFLSHLTTEARVHIEQSNKVLYLVNNPAMEDWLLQVNETSEPLNNLYKKYSLREDCYSAITQYILEKIKQNLHTCVVLYGHPTIFAKPALDAAKLTKEAGYPTKILPGISSEDCLFADLMIDPATSGCQSYEATDFLIHRRKFDNTSHLILWQVDVIGELGHTPDNKRGIPILIDRLKCFYPSDHIIILYEASQFPHFKPKITSVTLSALANATILPITTLYIPPACKAEIDHDTVNSLNINIADLCRKE